MVQAKLAAPSEFVDTDDGHVLRVGGNRVATPHSDAWNRSLSIAQRNAVGMWTNGHAPAIARAVRGQSIQSGSSGGGALGAGLDTSAQWHYEELGRNFGEAVKTAPQYQAPVYRRVGGLSAKQFARIVSARSIVSKAPISFSTFDKAIPAPKPRTGTVGWRLGNRTTKSNSDGYEVRFVATRHNGADIRSLSVDPTQGEIVIPSGTRFVITRVSRLNGGHTAIVSLVADDASVARRQTTRFGQASFADSGDVEGFFRDSQGKVHPIHGPSGGGAAKGAPQPTFKVGEQTPNGPRLTPYDSDEIVAARHRNETATPTWSIQTPERQALRQKITADMYGTGAAKKNKEAWILTGPPGAGKSTYANAEFMHKTGSLLIDPDEAKKRIPEFNGVNSSQVHQESTKITNDLMAKALQNGDNFVYPTTGRDAGYVHELADRLASRGYTAHLRLIDLPTDKAVGRAVSRFNDPNDGRFVDPSFVQSVNGKPKEAYDYVKSNFKGDYHDFEAYSSDVPRGQPLKRTDGEEPSSGDRNDQAGKRRVGMAGHLRPSEQAGRNQSAQTALDQKLIELSQTEFANGFFTDSQGKVHPIGGRDPHGRFNPHGTITPVAEQNERPLLADLKKEGGFTFQTHQGAHAKDGFAVSPYPEREKVFKGRVTRADMHTYMAHNDDLLSKTDHYVGGWHDEEHGLTYLDVSVVNHDEGKAADVARQFHQEAYFDLGKKQEVRVHARQDEASASKNSRYPAKEAERRRNRFSARSALWNIIARRRQQFSDDGRDEPGSGVTGKALMSVGFFTDSEGRVHPIMDTTNGQHFPNKLSELHNVKSLGGSTGARLMADDEGRQYVLKRGGNPGHIENEMSANQAYMALGVPVPGFKRYEDSEGPAQLSQFVDGKTLADMPNQKAALKQLGQYFAAHALLANWDAHGLENDNVMFEHGDVKKPVFIDNGGALEYRAMGEKKPGFPPQVREFDTLRDPSRRVSAAFASLTGDQIRKQVSGLNERRDALLASVPSHLVSTMGARLDDLTTRAKKATFAHEHTACFSGALKPSGAVSGFYTDSQGRIHPLIGSGGGSGNGNGHHAPPLPAAMTGMRAEQAASTWGIPIDEMRGEIEQHQLPVWSDPFGQPVYNMQDMVGTALHIRGMEQQEPKRDTSWTGNLTSDEVSAVKQWKDASTGIKSAARMQSANDQNAQAHPFQDALRNFESALNKAPVQEGSVHRGIGDLSDGAYDAIVRSSVIRSKSPVSFGQHRQLIKDIFLGNKNKNSVLFSTSNHNARHIDDVETDLSGEDEAVVPRGSVYRIKAVREQRKFGGGRHADIDIEYAPGAKVPRGTVELSAFFAEGQRFFTDSQGKVHPISEGGGGPRGSEAGSDGPERLLAPSLTAPQKDKALKETHEYFTSLGADHDTMVRNMLSVYDRATPKNKADGHEWYTSAKGSATKLGTQFGMSHRSAVGLIAATSPQTEWEANLDHAVKIAKVSQDRDGSLTIPTLASQIVVKASKKAGRKPFDADNYHGKDKTKHGQSFVGTHKISELPDDVLAAFHPSFKDILPDSVVKGMRLMRGEEPDKVLGGSKVRSFFNAIMQPKNEKSGTIDTHMVRAMANNARITSDQAHKIYVNTPGRYDYMKRALFDAAAARKENPNDMQAIIWTQWKSEHPQKVGKKKGNATARLAARPLQAARR